MEVCKHREWTRIILVLLLAKRSQPHYHSVVCQAGGTKTVECQSVESKKQQEYEYAVGPGNP